jgi:pyrroloquinoline-quinone synthase
MEAQQIVEKTFKNDHPFEKLLDNGLCTQKQIQAWLCNRYCFQKTMIVKDAIVLAKCSDRRFRQIWIKRIQEADEEGGGLDSWIKLGHACDVDVTDESKVYPATKFAMEAFINWCQQSDWVVIVASSLSQIKAAVNHQKKFDTWYNLYPWIKTDGLDYFIQRAFQASSDSQHCLEFIKGIDLPVDKIAEATKIKREIMTCMLDAIYLNSVINK